MELSLDAVNPRGSIGDHHQAFILYKRLCDTKTDLFTA